MYVTQKCIRKNFIMMLKKNIEKVAAFNPFPVRGKDIKAMCGVWIGEGYFWQRFFPLTMTMPRYEDETF